MDTKIELYDYFQGFPVQYDGILRWQWDAEGTQLIPSLPGGIAGVQLIDTTGLNISERSGFRFSVSLVDLSAIQLMPSPNGTLKRYVIKCALYLMATERATTIKSVLDRWPGHLAEEYYLEYAQNYLP